MKTRFIVIGLAACFLTAAFLGHFRKEFIATNHINDYHIGQYLDGGVFLLTTYFISHLFGKNKVVLKNTLVIAGIGIAFCNLYGDLYKTAGAVCMGFLLILSAQLSERKKKNCNK